MAKTTVSELEERLSTLEAKIDTMAYIRRQLEIQVAVLAKALAGHLGVESLSGREVQRVCNVVSDSKKLVEGKIGTISL